MKLLEKHVEANCDRLMAGLGYTAIRFSQPRNTMQTPGIPDRRYYRADAFLDGSGHSFWFECKRPGGKQSAHQKAFQQLVHSCGEPYVVGGLEDLASWLVNHAPMGRLQREALRRQFAIPAPGSKP